MEIVPEISQVLAALSESEDCAFAGMSGSGATCFGLYEAADQAQSAANRISRQYPDWWVRATTLRSAE